MAGQSLVLRRRPFSWRDVLLLIAILVILSAGAASISLLILDSILHTYTSFRLDAILAGAALIALAAMSLVTLVCLLAEYRRKIGTPLLEIGEDGIWVQRGSEYRIPWNRIERVRLQSNIGCFRIVSLRTADPAHTFAVQQPPPILDRLRDWQRHVIRFHIDRFDVDAEQLARRLQDESRAHGCVFEETPISLPKSRIGYTAAFLGGLFFLLMLIYGAWQLGRGWSMLFKPNIEIAEGRVSDVLDWYFRGQTHDFNVGHNILTFTLAGRNERFSIHSYEPGFEPARSIVRPGRIVTVVAEPDAERNKQGHRVLYLQTAGTTVTDRANSWFYRAWVAARLIFGTSIWLLGVIGGYVTLYETWKRFRRRVVARISP
jgi:hypothetical protein